MDGSWAKGIELLLIVALIGGLGARELLSLKRDSRRDKNPKPR